MIFARYICTPGLGHPEIERVGEAYVNCWLRVRSFSVAKALAERSIKRQNWNISALEVIERIPAGHYQNQEADRQYFEQAKIDREVYLFHLAPKYPVYRVDFEATSTHANKEFPVGTCADVKYWVVNEEVSDSSDVFDGFWDKLTHQRKAISLGRKRIQSEKWRVTAVISSQPVNSQTSYGDPLLTQYYEEAEEFGDCLAFWTD